MVETVITTPPIRYPNIPVFPGQFLFTPDYLSVIINSGILSLTKVSYFRCKLYNLLSHVHPPFPWFSNKTPAEFYLTRYWAAQLKSAFLSFPCSLGWPIMCITNKHIVLIICQTLLWVLYKLTNLILII